MGLLLFVVRTSFLAFVVAAVLTLWMRRRARTEHRRVLLALKESAKQSGLALLSGRLVVEGSGLAPEVGRPHPRKRGEPISIAARTHWGSLDRLWLASPQPSNLERAEIIYLDTAKGRVRVGGELKIDIGSSLRVLGTRTWIDASTRYGIETTIFDGDEVSILGNVRHETTSATTDGGYRDALPASVIEPVDETQFLRVAAAAPPKVSFELRALLRQRAMVAVVLIGAVLGNAVANDYQVARGIREESCRSWGGCHIDSNLRWDGLAAIGEMAHGDFFTVRTHVRSECTQSEQCLSSGRCSVIDGKCEARNDDDCRFSTDCRNGSCTAKDGRCIIGKDADCEMSSMCRFGWCSAVNGKCAIGKDADCKGTDGCRFYGQCTFNGNDSCVPGTDEDCARSEGCRSISRKACTLSRTGCASPFFTDEDCRKRPECAQFDRCFAHGHECVLPESHCADSDACRVFGLCGDGPECVARTSEDCSASTRCKTDRACKLIGRECAASCETSDQCRRLGACTESKGACVIGGDADCQKSDACKDSGRCTLRDGTCGRGDADCAKSDDCKRSGKCFAGELPGYCFAKKTDDCRASDACREKGLCTAEGGECVLRSNDDCALTLGCEARGECDRLANECVLSDSGCKHLAACKELGKCSLVVDEYVRSCQATTDADCRASTVCERFGWCTPLNGDCFVPSFAQ